jgi:D-alanyl-D-alanine carboxypeptidase
VVLLSYARKRLNFTPGSRYKYSNSDNIVVGLMVQAATGETYPGELRARVLAPLGLARTSLPRGTALPAPFVHGYMAAPPHPPGGRNPHVRRRVGMGLWRAGLHAP